MDQRLTKSMDPLNQSLLYLFEPPVADRPLLITKQDPMPDSPAKTEKPSKKPVTLKPVSSPYSENFRVLKN